MFMSKKGYTLLEVTLGLALFSILILGTLTLEASKIKLKAVNRKKENYIQYIEALKSSIINDITYSDLRNDYTKGNRYINHGNINLDKIKNQEIQLLLEDFIENEELYIDITLSEEIPVKVTMKYHINNSLINEVITCEFYKGSY